jgi:hypothetical protein
MDGEEAETGSNYPSCYRQGAGMSACAFIFPAFQLFKTKM